MRQQLHVKVLRLMCGLTVALGLLYGAYFIRIGLDVSALIAATAVTTGVAAMAYATRTGRYRVALDGLNAVLFAMFALMALFQDGINSPALWWLIAPPVIALVTGSISLGAVLCGLFVVEAAALAHHGPGSWSELSLLAEDRQLQTSLAVTMSMTFLSLVVSSGARWMMQLQEAIELSHRAAMAASEAKVRFVAHLSHEIRSPLQGMIGATEMLGRASITPPQRKQLVAVQEQSARTLLSLVNDVLDFSKLEARKMALDKTRLQLRSLVFEVNELFSVQAFAKGIELTSSCATDVPDTAIGDAGRIRQIVSNLVSNAVKFTATGGVHIHVGFDESGSGASPIAKAAIRIEVTDTGIGIDEQRLAWLFKPFHQADATVTRHYGGTGLGLSISRSLAQLMGGRLRVRSRLGKGSTFALILPLEFVGQLRPAKAESRHGRAAWVATANDGLARHVTSRLEQLGCDVRSFAAWPDEAALARSRPDFVLVDAALLPLQPEDARLQVADLAAHCDKVAVVLPVSAEAASQAVAGAALVYKPVRLSSLRFLLEGAESGLMPLADEDALGEDRRSRVVLIVDDDPTSQIVVQSMLTRPRTVTLTACNGEDALEALSRQRVDIVLMDVQMPLLDGLAATRLLRGREQAAGLPRIPVIAMTGTSDAAEKAACLEAGMDAFLVKPFRADDVRHLVDSVLLLQRKQHADPAC